MKIGIDVTFLFDQYSGRGIGRYGKELVKNLLSKHNEDVNEWYLFGFNDLEKNIDALDLPKSYAKRVKFVSLGKPRSSNPLNLFTFRLFFLPKIKKAKLDVYFAPHFERGLPLGKVPTVVMMHDVIPFVTKKYSQRGSFINWFKGIFYRRRLNQAKQADVIITNSDFSQRELVNKAGFDAKKIRRIYLGISNEFRAENITKDTRDIRRTLVMYKITKPYYLYYGGLESNKNIPAMLEAFSIASKRHPDLKLVIAGKEFKLGWDNRAKPLTPGAIEVLEAIDELKLKHKVILTGEILQKHLPIVLQNSLGFIHLSTYEGFGFSVLEAQAAGVPVIASRRSSYPEVLGDGARYITTFDKDIIAEAILDITQDQSLRTKLIRSGLTISNSYDWILTANATYDELKRLGNRIKPLKIGYVIPNFYPFQGGAENNCYHLAKLAVENGHLVTVFTAIATDSDLPRFEELNGINVHRFQKRNSQYYLGFYPELLKALLSTRLDVIHVHGFGFIWHDFCLFLKKLLSPKTKFINTPHGPFMAHGVYSFKEKLLKFLYTQAQRIFLNFLYNIVIQVNPEQYKWIKSYRINRNKIVYLPNGIEDTLFKELNTNKTIEEYGLNRKFVISAIGRYERYKGFSDLIAAMSMLVKEKKNLKLILMGKEGKFLTELQNMVKEKELEKYVQILISPEDALKYQLLQVSDIYIMSSKWEAFGISILEAMAKNNAIISTRTEGGEFLIKFEENGFLYDYNDVNELARFILNLIDDKKLLKNIQSNNIAKAHSFIWKDISAKYSNLLKELTK